MASGQVVADGRVIAPLNITAPTPSLNLKGFRWQTSDEKLLGPQPQPQPQFHAQISSKAITQPVPAVPFQAPVAAVPAPVAPVAVTPAAVAPAASTPQPAAPVSGAPLPPKLAGLTFDSHLGATQNIPPFPLTQLQGAYAGNGFNLIWRPRAKGDTTKFPVDIDPDPQKPQDNILQLSLTTEQLTFGEMIGDIPNRGLKVDSTSRPTDQETITLKGFPYLQTVQDVTNPDTGLGDHLIPSGIHFEPGMFLWVPKSGPNPTNGESVVRMASIPHGTTINAQGLSPTGPVQGPPNFDTDNKLDMTPHGFDNFKSKQTDAFKPAMTANDSPLLKLKAPARIPQDLTAFKKAGTITSEIILNPNLVLKNAIEKLTIKETISFVVATGPSTTPGGAVLNGGGTANISFLHGIQSPSVTSAAPKSNDSPNAHAAFMTARYWIETVLYTVKIPKVSMDPTVGGTCLLRPKMPTGCTAPTPVFAVTFPTSNKTEKEITIPGIQVQCSQVVNLNFATLTWPHASVSTLVPVDPQPFTLKPEQLV